MMSCQIPRVTHFFLHCCVDQSTVPPLPLSVHPVINAVVHFAAWFLSGRFHIENIHCCQSFITNTTYHPRAPDLVEEGLVEPVNKPTTAASATACTRSRSSTGVEANQVEGSVGQWRRTLRVLSGSGFKMTMMQLFQDRVPATSCLPLPYSNESDEWLACGVLSRVSGETTSRV